MAFGAQQQFPNDLRPRVGIGVDLPFSNGNGFTPNFTTQEAIKYNLINFFLTNPGERPGNPQFGGGLRKFIFESITIPQQRSILPIIHYTTENVYMSRSHLTIVSL